MSEENEQLPRVVKEGSQQVTKLGARIVSVVFMLGTVGQIAWAIENTWFNTFIYDEITPDPAPIAWMVAVSAVTATLTTLFMGTLSDRTKTKIGIRRPFILFGYILWGIVTAIFPTVSLIQKIGVAVVMVVIVDAVMTFFGSTANDAAFNAWLTDVSDSTNRNRIQGYNSITILLANLIALGAAGILIDTVGYFIFFYIMGGLVTVIGLIAGLLLKEPKLTQEKIDEIEEKKKKPFFKELIDIVKPENIKKNKILYLLFLNMAIAGIGQQVSMPYLFVYIEYALGYTKTDLSIIGGAVILLSAIVSLLVGLFGHKMNRLLLLYIGIFVNSAFLLSFAFVQNIFLVIAMYFLALSGQMVSTIALTAWMLDEYPKDKIGKYQGVRMIFFVAIPMVIGPPIGSAIIRNLGTPAIINGQEGYIPHFAIFIVAAIIILLSIIPLFFIKWTDGKIKFEKVSEEINQ